MRKIAKFCNKYLKKHRLIITLFMTLTIISAVISLFIPYISGSFIDYLVTSSELTQLYRFCYIFALLSIGGIILGFCINRLLTIIQIKISYEIERDLIQHIQHLSLSFLDKMNTAYMTQRITADANSLTTFYILFIQNIFINTLLLIVPTILLIVFNFRISLILIFLLITYISAYAIFKKPLQKVNLIFKEKQAEFFNKLYEQLYYIRLIKIHGMLILFIERLQGKFEEIFNISLKQQKIHYIYSGLDNLIITIAQISLYLFGGYAVLKNELSIGQFTIISTYFTMVVQAIRYYFNLGKSIQENLVSYHRMYDIINIQTETYGSYDLESIKNIEISNISFSYNDRKVLNKFSYNFSKGKIYVVYGPNGSGKSTLINIIIGMYIDEYEGLVKFNNKSIKEIDMNDVRKNLVGYVEQNPILFESNIKYNLNMDESVMYDDEYIFDVAHKLGMLDFINNFSGNLETEINEKSRNISGGEKQKISLLRVFLKKPDLLLLDEPTAALDVSTKNKLINHLVNIKQHHIIIIVTHDDAFLEISDQTITFPCTDAVV